MTSTRCNHIYIKRPYRKRGNSRSDSSELYHICLHYVCGLCFQNTKVSAIFSSSLERNKALIYGCIYIPGCSSAFFSILMLGCAPEWVAASCWAETQPPFTYSALDFHGKKITVHANTSPAQTNMEPEPPAACTDPRPVQSRHRAATSTSQSS